MPLVIETHSVVGCDGLTGCKGRQTVHINNFPARSRDHSRVEPQGAATWQTACSADGLSRDCSALDVPGRVNLRPALRTRTGAHQDGRVHEQPAGLRIVGMEADAAQPRAGVEQPLPQRLRQGGSAVGSQQASCADAASAEPDTE